MTGDYSAPFGQRTPPFGATRLPVQPASDALIEIRGAPEGVLIGIPGQRCRDTATGNIYAKLQGTAKLGWVLIGNALTDAVPGTGTGGAANIISSQVDPNGVSTVTGAGVCIGYGLMQGWIWVTVNGTTWIAVVAPG